MINKSVFYVRNTSISLPDSKTKIQSLKIESCIAFVARWFQLLGSAVKDLFIKRLLLSIIKFLRPTICSSYHQSTFSDSYILRVKHIMCCLFVNNYQSQHLTRFIIIFNQEYCYVFLVMLQSDVFALALAESQQITELVYQTNGSSIYIAS